MKIMRTSIMAAALAITAAFTSSCYIRVSDEAKKELKEKLEFEKEVREQTYVGEDPVIIHPGAFTKLVLSDWADVKFVQREGEPEVVVTGTYRSRDLVTVENEDGVLGIYYKTFAGMSFYNDETITLYAPGFKILDKSGSGDFEGGIRCDSLVIRKSGSGDIDMKVEAELLDVSSIGSGDVKLEGYVGKLIIEKSGSGDIDAASLEAKDVSVNKTGSGDITYRHDGKVVEYER